MAIPKEGYFKLEQGRYGPVFPRTPANYGFTVIAKVKPGREKAIREYGKTIEEAVKGDPTCSRRCGFTISVGSCSMSALVCTSCIRASSTPILTNISRMPLRFSSSTGITTVFVNLEGWPEDWKTNAASRDQILSRSPEAKLSGIRRISVCYCGRSQEGAESQKLAIDHARPDAVKQQRSRSCRTRRTWRPGHFCRATCMSLPYGGSVMLEFDDLQYIIATRVPAITGRYEFLSFRQPAQGRAWLKGILDKVASVQQVRDSIEREQRWVSVAFTWQGLRALGVDEQSLATFPKEFRDGMVGTGGSAR